MNVRDSAGRLDYTRAAEMGRAAALDDASYVGEHRLENPFPDSFDWREARDEWDEAYDSAKGAT